jgi:hypothetical protein
MNLPAQECEVEMRTINKLTILFTRLCSGFKPSAAMRLAIIGAMVWCAASTAAYSQSAGTTIIVNTASDGVLMEDPFDPSPMPQCRLRDAITAANTNRPVGGCPAGRPSPALDTILFDIGTGTPVIKVQMQLPPILESVVIDGGSFGATRVELDGSRASFVANPQGQRVHGLFLATGDSTISNMVINRFNGNGIVMTTLTGGSISEYTPPEITGPSMPAELPCHARPAEPDCSPGGSGGGYYMPDPRGAGARNRVLGCFIGTDATGTVAMGNGSGLFTAGIVTDTELHTIGGTRDSERNVISGNFGQGIILGGRGHSVRGNFIGVDASGNMPLGNQFDGINIAGGPLSDATGSIGANTIASDPDCRLLAGDDRLRCGNRIAFNGGNGVNVGFNAYAILSNAIFSNGSLGINLEDPAPTPVATDPARNSPALGPYWAYVWDPLLRHFVVTIDVTIDNFPNQPTTVQLFENDSCDPSGFGEGAVLIKTLTGLTNGRHRIVLPTAGGLLTATATTTLVLPKTSEFSNCFRAGFK